MACTPIPRLLLVVVLLVLAGFTATPPRVVQVPVQPVPGARPSPVPLPARLWLPADGTARVPVVILLHGCAGWGNGRELRDWAAMLTAWGYGVIAADSLTPRGVKTVCAPEDQPLVTAADRAGDTIDVALYVATLPGVDAGRLAVIGFSHGGGTVVAVTQRRFETLHPGLFKAAVDYYGPCRQPQLHGDVPLLVFAGLDDDWGNPAATCTNFGAHLGFSQPFQIVTYPGTVHAFDNAALVRRRFNVGHPLQYNATSAADSFTRVRAFLARWVPP